MLTARHGRYETSRVTVLFYSAARAVSRVRQFPPHTAVRSHHYCLLSLLMPAFLRQVMRLTPLEPQSRFGDKVLEI